MTTQAVGGRVYEFGLGDRLRAAREQAGYTQRDFADAIGISKNTVSNYETEATRVKRPVLAQWALLTGFSIHWLETGELPDPGDGDGSVVVTHEHLWVADLLGTVVPIRNPSEQPGASNHLMPAA